MLPRMIVRSIDEIAGTDRDVSGETWRSRRLIRRDDGVEHSVHYTEIRAGSEQHLWYKNHYETNLCIAGEGEVVDVATGETHQLRPGTMYVLDQHDRHILRAHTDVTLVCTFWPALTGGEKHDADGSYLPAAD
jgi:L-ectoine synthase